MWRGTAMQRGQGVQQSGKGGEVGAVGGAELPIRCGQFQLTTGDAYLTETLIVDAALHVAPVLLWAGAPGQEADHIHYREEPPILMPYTAHCLLSRLVVEQRHSRRFVSLLAWVAHAVFPLSLSIHPLHSERIIPSY